MKALLATLALVTPLSSTFASAPITVTVQCNDAGPLLPGVLSIPANGGGECVGSGNGKNTYTAGLDGPVTFTFNSLAYTIDLGIVTTDNRCSLDGILGTDGAWATEQHSNRGEAFSIRSIHSPKQGYVGTIGTCSFKSN